MSKKRGSSFRDKTRKDSHRQKTRATQYGHLNLPKGISLFQEEPGGKARLDFLPYEVTDPKHPDRSDEDGIAIVGELWYKRPYRLHRNIGSNNETAVCLTSIGKKCPICEYRKELMRQGGDKKQTDALRYSNRNLYVVVPKGMGDFEEEPHIWDIAQGNFQKALNDELEEDEQYGDFPDLEQGLTLRIRFSTEVFSKNEYAKTSRIDFIDREDPYDEEILKSIPNLDEVLQIPTFKEAEAKFLEEDDEEEEEGKEKTSTEDKPQGKSPKQEDDTQDDEDECIACEGDGKNSKGNVCRICGGSGKKKEKEKDDEEGGGKGTSKKDNGKKKCPHGHRYALDCEKEDDCDECEEWGSCIEEKEKREKE